jgi:hypothetical protein
MDTRFVRCHEAIQEEKRSGWLSHAALWGLLTPLL